MGKDKLIKISEFRIRYFEKGQAPCQRTVRRWIVEGLIKGRTIMNGTRISYWVDANDWECTTGDSAVDDILAGFTAKAA